MFTIQRDGRSAGRKKKEPTKQDSYREGIFDSILVRGLIVLLCLILVTLALVSIYGYSHNATESSDETASTKRNDNARARSGEEPCNLTGDNNNNNTIRCYNIPHDTGEFVANFINANSNNWPTDKEYKLHIENCFFPGDTLSAGWLPVLNTEIIISTLHITTSVPTTIEENAFSDKNFQNITYLTLEGSIVQLNKKCFGGLHDLDTLELTIVGDSIRSVAEGILNDVPNLSTLQIQSEINDEHLNEILWNTTLPKLQTLAISNNNLKKLKSDTLKGLTNLLTLDAMFSNLTSIESTILESSANKIQKVNFASNELQTLPVDIFNIKSTRTTFSVFLQQNKLKTLPEGIFDKANQSSETVQVSLENNDWECDCHLAWLRNYMDQEIIHVPDHPMCASPPINKGKLLIDADFSSCITSSLPSTSSTMTPEVSTSSTTETDTSDPTTPSTIGNTTDSPSSTTETDTSDPTTPSTIGNTTDSPSSTTETDTSDPTTPSTIGNTTDSPSSTTETDTSDPTTPSTIGNTTDSPSSTTETDTSDPTTPSTIGNTTDSPSSTTETDTSDPTTPSTIGNTTDSPSSIPEGYIEANCNCTTCSSEYIPSMTIDGIEYLEIKDDDIEKKIVVTIGAANDHVLIWMNSTDINTECNYKHFMTEHKHFMTEHRSLRYLTASFETAPNTSYTICAGHIISEKEIMVLPMNCRAYTTLPRIEDRAWLLNKEIDSILLILCFALLVSVTVGGATIYYVVLHNPKLIKGNKRVIVVYRPTGKVILVMPEGYSETDTRRPSQISPIPPIEPTTVDQIACKFRQMCDKLRDNCKTESATVVLPQQEPSSLTAQSISDTSDTSYYTALISETTYVTVTEPTTVRLMAQKFNQMCHELTNESYS